MFSSGRNGYEQRRGYRRRSADVKEEKSRGKIAGQPIWRPLAYRLDELQPTVLAQPIFILVNSQKDFRSEAVCARDAYLGCGLLMLRQVSEQST
jgi:hypothetical protein